MLKRLRIGNENLSFERLHDSIRNSYKSRVEHVELKIIIINYRTSIQTHNVAIMC